MQFALQIGCFSVCVPHLILPFHSPKGLMVWLRPLKGALISLQRRGARILREKTPLIPRFKALKWGRVFGLSALRGDAMGLKRLKWGWCNV